MIKREVIIFFVLILNISLVVSEIPSPVVIEGYITDIVTGDIIKEPIVTITNKWSSINANTIINSPGKHDIGHYDGVVIGLAGDSIKVSAYNKNNPLCKGESSKVLTGDGKLLINVQVCCPPASLSNLKPDKPLHLTSPIEIEFSWISGNKGSPDYPDIWTIFKGPQTILDVIGPLKLKLNNLEGWSLQTCNGISGTDKYCCVEKSVGVGAKNNPCPAPTNLNGYLKKGFVVTTWNSETKDIDGDECHDEWKALSLKENENLTNPSWAKLIENANKLGELAPAYVVSYWQVRSCDNQKRGDSCSEWISVITPSCNKISDECPNLYNVKNELSNFDELGTEIYCDGVKIKDKELIKSIELRPKKGKITLQLSKGKRYDLDYCPWCYDKIKNYDEDEIDCSYEEDGSCPQCGEIREEKPKTIKDYKLCSIKKLYWICSTPILLIIILIIFIIILITNYHKKVLLKIQTIIGWRKKEKRVMR